MTTAFAQAGKGCPVFTGCAGRRELGSVEPASINNPALKIAVLRYFAEVEQPGVTLLIARFLQDSNKTVVIEALKALKSLKVKYDVAVLVPFVEGMSDVGPSSRSRSSMSAPARKWRRS